MSDYSRLTERLGRRFREQIRVLGMPYYTWWFEHDRLELFRPLTELIQPSEWSDWYRLIEGGDKAFVSMAEKYDHAVDSLEAACRTYQTVLVSRNELRQLFDVTISDSTFIDSGLEPATLFGSRWPDRPIDYLAQLLVNRTPAECPPIYTIRPYWERYASHFTQLAEQKPYVHKAADCQQRADDVMHVMIGLEQILSGL